MLLLLALAAAEEPDRLTRRAQARALREHDQQTRVLEDVDLELRALEIELEAMRHHEDRLLARRASLQAQLAEGEEDLASRKAAMGSSVRLLHITARSGPPEAALDGDAAELRRTVRYVWVLLESMRTNASTFVADMEELQRQQSQVEANLDAVDAVQAELRLAEGDLRSRRAETLARLDRLDVPETVTRPCGAFRERFGALRWPAWGPVVQAYGPTPTGFHRGIDIAAVYNAPVRAVACGTVLHAQYIDGQGLTVVVDHGDDYRSTYTNLGAVTVRPGDPVEPGARLGLVGPDALGFGVQKNRSAMNPEKWLVEP